MPKKAPSNPNPEPPAAAPPPAPPRGRQSAAPLCPYCEVHCTAGRSTPIITYYYCPNRADGSCPGNYSVQVPRPEAIRARRAAPPDPNAEGFSAR